MPPSTTDCILDNIPVPIPENYSRSTPKGTSSMNDAKS